MKQHDITITIEMADDGNPQELRDITYIEFADGNVANQEDSPEPDDDDVAAFARIVGVASVSAEERFSNLEAYSASIDARLEAMLDARSAMVVAKIEADEAALAIEEATGITSEQELIDVTTLARRLDVGQGKVRKMVRCGKLPCLRVGNTLRFDWAEVVAELRDPSEEAAR
mgnify:CR=1 FL=1